MGARGHGKLWVPLGASGCPWVPQEKLPFWVRSVALFTKQRFLPLAKL